MKPYMHIKGIDTQIVRGEIQTLEYFLERQILSVTAYHDILNGLGTYDN